MTEQEEIKCIKQTIDEAIKGSSKKFIIVPFGRYGRMAKEILERDYNINDSLVVDNYKYDNKTVYKLSDLPLEDGKDYTFLNVSKDYTGIKLMDQIYHLYGDRYKVYKVEYFSDKQLEICNAPDKTRLDFLCVGFAKCGTTSLDAALKKNPKVFLPKMKETIFMLNMTDRGADLLKYYYNEEAVKGKIVGDIDPHAIVFPERAYKYYGADTKIIIMVRNPVGAITSRFLWDARFMGCPKSVHTFEEANGVINPTTFKNWLLDDNCRNMKIYNYGSITREWIRYFGRDNVKIIISEEMYKNTSEIMDDVQHFIGLDDSDIMDYPQFPATNSSAHISTDFKLSKMYSEAMSLMDRATVAFPDTYDDFMNIRNKIWKKISVPFDKDSLLTDEVLQIIRDGYTDEIKSLEEIMDRPLDEYMKI
ncbi:MAG: sulfotransferase domain-containing protein [Lachnospiraceae bacterium]|nr:sulfotransferase domain-containing protein [Lachnospiraceae bacterium]